MPRLDSWLVTSGRVRSRDRAKELIKAGCVSIAGEVVTKPATLVMPEAAISVHDDLSGYVGRGAVKLLSAFAEFDIDARGLIALDIGASTGGFTQVLLEQGAKMVYAIDVGHDQLAAEMKNDERVVDLSGTHILDVSRYQIPVAAECAVVDLSFISLKHIGTTLSTLLAAGAWVVVLVKPQFEVGRGKLNGQGVVRSELDRLAAIASAIASLINVGFEMQAITPAPIAGEHGNREVLVHLVHSAEPRSSRSVIVSDDEPWLQWAIAQECTVIAPEQHDWSQK